MPLPDSNHHKVTTGEHAVSFQVEHHAISQSQDEVAVRRLYEQMMEGWNRGSAEMFAAPFTENADFIAFDGTHFKGRREIEVSHQALFEKWLKGTRLVGEVTGVRFVASDVAVMHARGSTIMQGRAYPSPERDSIQTLIATRHETTWLVEAFHNTRIRPIGRSLSGTGIWVLTDWLWKLCRPRK